jgi:hypothetical protein
MIWLLSPETRDAVIEWVFFTVAMVGWGYAFYLRNTLISERMRIIPLGHAYVQLLHWYGIVYERLHKTGG